MCHAGAASELVIPGAMKRVFRHSHTRLRELAASKLPTDRRAALRAGFAKLSGEPYDYMARHYLAVSGPNDPRYDDLLVGFLASSYPMLIRCFCKIIISPRFLKILVFTREIYNLTGKS